VLTGVVGKYVTVLGFGQKSELGTNWRFAWAAWKTPLRGRTKKKGLIWFPAG